MTASKSFGFKANLPATLSKVTTIIPAFLVVYTFVVLTISRGASSRDPGSWFFRPQSAYPSRYSTTRRAEAGHFIKLAETAPPSIKHNPTGHLDHASLCIGIPSRARKGKRYLRTTVGSLLAGLSETEINELHIVVLLAHTDNDAHPAGREAWFNNTVDERLRYDEQHLTPAELGHVRDMEAGSWGREKSLFDYAYVLQACIDYGAPYILMLEDDTLALDGWYHRTKHALKTAEEQTARLGRSSFLYLRLFYTEKYLGWNSERLVKPFVGLSAAVIVAFGLLSLLAPTWLRHHRRTLVASLAAAVLVNILFLAAGKATVFPMPAGVNLMPKYGCCSQALVYPLERARDLVAMYRATRIGFVDSLTEEYADRHDELRWALTPSVLQHIGSQTSKDQDHVVDGGVARDYSHLSEAETLWNFAFELNDPVELRREHLLAQSIGPE